VVEADFLAELRLFLFSGLFSSVRGAFRDAGQALIHLDRKGMEASGEFCREGVVDGAMFPDTREPGQGVRAYM